MKGKRVIAGILLVGILVGTLTGCSEPVGTGKVVFLLSTWL